MRKFLLMLVTLPVAVVLIGWAVANRESVVVSFDPFDPDHPAYAMTLPLYILGFAILILGVVLGGLATWLEQGKSRRARARLAAELAAMRSELDHVRRQALAREARSRETRALTHPSAYLLGRPPAA
jgi:hypothetical protein